MRTRFVMLIALALAVLAPAAHASYPGGNGKIVFAESGPQLSTVNADGSGYQVLAVGNSFEPAWSPDGEQIAFVTAPSSASRGAITVINADGTGRRTLTDRGTSSSPTWSPDGQQLALVFDRCGCIALTRLDGTESRVLYKPQTPVVTGDVCGTPSDLEWAPTGTTIAFSGSPRLANGNCGAREIFVVESDGTGLTQVTNEADYATDPDWSPDGERIAYDISWDGSALTGTPSIITIRRDGTDRTVLFSQGSDPTWAPDGGEVGFVARTAGGSAWQIEAQRTNHVSHRTVMLSPTVKFDLDWQRVDPGFTGYPRPKAASPAKFSLVPAYERCNAPNRTHGPSLAFPSCSPPAPRSSYVTVGTPDTNGQPTRFVGELEYNVVLGNPSTPEDEADVQLTAELTDVRCRVAGPPCTAGELSDYTGNLRLQFGLRITDKHNALGHSITTQDTDLFFDLPCSVTPASVAGSDCNSATTLEALVPGAVPERKRSIWQLDRIAVYDGGPNGDHSVGTTAPFAVPGIWVP